MIRERHKKLVEQVKERRALRQQRKAVAANTQFTKLVQRIEALEKRVKDLEG